MTETEKLGEAAARAARVLAALDTEKKNNILHTIADSLEKESEYILSENEKDLKAADESGMSDSMKDRLRLTSERICAIADGIRKVAALSDPVGEVIEEFTRPNGLVIEKRRVPLGVVGVIYESRPNVTADTAALCIKASNAVILRGGKEAIHSNTAIANVMKSAADSAGITPDIIGFVTDTSRASANEMMQLNKYIDVLIPRGGAGLINAVVQNATVPVIETGVGNCHIYVDKSADIQKAVDIIINAKASRPSVCNAAESLLVHKDVDGEFYKKLDAAFAKNGIRVLASGAALDKLTCEREATEEDFAKEFLDKIISVKEVADIDEALEHILKYSTKHSECIVTEDKSAAEKFTRAVDAAAVYVNASTRFTDGFEFGFGAEIGISTQKLHARGPMGLRELTSYKYIVRGNGQIRV